MGFLDTIRDALALPSMASGMAIESPWASPNHLLPITVDDRLATGAVTRAQAMRVPAVARARRLIVGTIARLPLQVTASGEPIDKQPLWLSRTNGPVSPFHRMAWTVDDLLFYGWSLWAVDRDAAGGVIAADRVPFEHWDTDPDGRVLYKGRTVADDQVVLIPSLDEGVLITGADAIRHAATLNKAAARAANTPSANIELHQTSGAALTPEQIKSLVDSWAAARRGDNGGVAYTNQSVEVREHGSFDGHLLVDGRNAAAVDIGRVMGIPAQMLDAQLPHASMTYTNYQARNVELIDYALAPLMGAIVARLGMDDLVASGKAVEFDTTALTALTIPDISVPDDTEGITK